MRNLGVRFQKSIRRVLLACLLVSVLGHAAFAQDNYLMSVLGVGSKVYFDPVINAAGELVGAREIVNGNVTTRIHRAWVSAEGMRLVHYNDDKVYLVLHGGDLSPERASHAWRGVRFYEVDDTGEVLLACAFWPEILDPYLLCFLDGSAVFVRAQNVSDDHGIEQYMVEGVGNDFFTVTRIPHPGQGSP